ncbi:hypothetical protein GCM10011363_35670 [Marivita lacus]|uniref:Uncharacterized protein n=1 Tax=Marivita lacus TaxID=1323742 RepID=A0ABQ1L197_9RHOB|nr:hypothetical protein GCM10011363_35670 [Marivita lacus]
MRADLGQEPFTYLDQLRSLGCQSSEKAQLFHRKIATCLGPEGEEARDEFGIDPVGLGGCATTLCKRLHLSGGHLPRWNTFLLQKRPDLPFLAASRFKADDGIPVLGKIRHGSMTCRSIRHYAAMLIGGRNGLRAANVRAYRADR